MAKGKRSTVASPRGGVGKAAQQAEALTRLIDDLNAYRDQIGPPGNSDVVYPTGDGKYISYLTGETMSELQALNLQGRYNDAGYMVDAIADALPMPGQPATGNPMKQVVQALDRRREELIDQANALRPQIEEANRAASAVTGRSKAAKAERDMLDRQVGRLKTQDTVLRARAAWFGTQADNLRQQYDSKFREQQQRAASDSWRNLR